MGNLENKFEKMNDPDKKGKDWIYYCKSCGHTEVLRVYNKYKKCVICGNNYKMPRRPE